jgi:futalosine hydrolase
MHKPYILIASATQLEMAFLLKKSKTIDGVETIETPKAIFHLLVSGIGSAITSFSLAKAFGRFKYQRAIQLGIAGSFDPKFPIGSLVKVGRDVFADLYFDNNGQPLYLHQAGFENFNRFPFQKSMLIPDLSLFNQIDLPTVNAITVNTTTGTDSKRKFWLHQMQCDIETMEGAAFYYVSMMENVPRVQIRAISNMVGARDTQKWKTDEAISNLEKLFSTILFGSEV